MDGVECTTHFATLILAWFDRSEPLFLRVLNPSFSSFVWLLKQWSEKGSELGGLLRRRIPLTWYVYLCSIVFSSFPAISEELQAHLSIPYFLVSVEGKPESEEKAGECLVAGRAAVSIRVYFASKVDSRGGTFLSPSFVEVSSEVGYFVRASSLLSCFACFDF